MKVPSTDISTINEEKKNLEVEINELKSKKEIMNNNIQDYANSLTDLNEQKIGLEGKLLDLGKSSDEIHSFVSSQTKEFNEFIQEQILEVDNLKNSIKFATNLIEEKKKEIDELNEKYKETKKSILRDSEVLARQKEDLNIYKERLERVIKELGLQTKIII